MSLLASSPVPLHLPALVELSSGIDAVYLSGRADPSEELLERLEAAKQLGQERDEPVEFELGDVLFQLSPFGWGKYTYSLEHAWGRLGVRKKGRLPELRVQARAEALHGASPASVVEFFEWLVAEGVGEVEWSVNRIDLYGDFQGWALTPEIGRRFVARPKQRVTYMACDGCTGVQFGKRAYGLGYCALRLAQRVGRIGALAARFGPLAAQRFDFLAEFAQLRLAAGMVRARFLHAGALGRPVGGRRRQQARQQHGQRAQRGERADQGCTNSSSGRPVIAAGCGNPIIRSSVGATSWSDPPSCIRAARPT